MLHRPIRPVPEEKYLLFLENSMTALSKENLGLFDL